MISATARDDAFSAPADYRLVRPFCSPDGTKQGLLWRGLALAREMIQKCSRWAHALEVRSLLPGPSACFTRHGDPTRCWAAYSLVHLAPGAGLLRPVVTCPAGWALF